MATQFQHLEQLDQEKYSQLSHAQKYTIICDIAEHMGFAFDTGRGGIRTELTIPEPADVNPREPYIVIYNNHARVQDNNGDLMLPEQYCWDELIEFECGFKKPTTEWREKNRHEDANSLKSYLSPIEIHQPSINVDYTDLSAIKKLLNLWFKLIDFDWDGKMIDPSINGA